MQVETCLPSIDAFDCNDPCFLQVESMDQMCDVGEQRPSQEESALTIQEMHLKFAGFAREMAEQRAKSEAMDRELAEQRAKSEKAARKHDRELAEQRAKSEEADREIAELRAKLEAADREKSEAADRELAEQRAKSEAADRELAEQRAKSEAADRELAEQRERIADLEKQVRPATDRKTFIPGDPQLSVYVLWKSIFNSKLCVTGYPSFFCETFWNLLPLLCLKSKLD